MKQRQSLLSRRANLPDRGHLRGVITVVQEDRFRLEDDLGRGYLFTLGRRNGVGLEKLHTWCDQRSIVEVEYRGAPDLGAVAICAREPSISQVSALQPALDRVLGADPPRDRTRRSAGGGAA